MTNKEEKKQSSPRSKKKIPNITKLQNIDILEDKEESRAPHIIFRSQTKIVYKQNIKARIKVQRKETQYQQTHKKHQRNTPAYPYLKMTRQKDILTRKDLLMDLSNRGQRRDYNHSK